MFDLSLTDFNFDVDTVLSAHSDTRLVMKGVTHGACDYLLKPVRLEELKNIWQHVVRRNKSENKEQNKTAEKAKDIIGDGNPGTSSENNSDLSKMLGKRRKDGGEEDEDDDEDNAQDYEDDPSAQKKPRVVWVVELHRKFVAAVDQLGLESEFM